MDNKRVSIELVQEGPLTNATHVAYDILQGSLELLQSQHLTPWTTAHPV